MIYKWKAGAQIRADANIAGAMCARLADEGRLTARALLDENRPASAPLHDAFEWDDTAAAELYREGQARQIIRCLCVVHEQAEPTRAFFNIERTAPNYNKIETILQSEDDAEKLRRTVLGELNAIRKKYQTINAFAEIWAAIDHAIEESA